jgi:K+-transporting ATPase ATPase A chain
MSVPGVLQIVLFFLVVAALVRPLGGYIARVLAGERTLLSRVIGPLERLTYRLCGIDPDAEQHWTVYTVAMLAFSLASVLVLYAMQRLQGVLPMNPRGLGGVAPDLAFNTAVSFTTNTNWQAYAGESTLGYAVQMAGLAVQNFASAAVGIAIAAVLIRGFARSSARTVGNFWADLVRATLYVLLPLCVVFSIVLVSCGVPQNLDAYTAATTLDGARQTIAQGPVASQEAIKMLGTNGGGFFNANSAHPFENPTPLSNFLEAVAIFVIGAALTNTFGRMVGSERQGWALFAAMSILFLAGVFAVYWAESVGNPAFARSGADVVASESNAGGNMEGKEVRFGIAASALFATATTDASCGAVNAMHDSFTPLGGLVLLSNIELGEIIVGGVGAGLYGMLLFAILAVFIAGLMVGRTPEYVGKKIEARELKMTVLALVLVLPLSILGLTALATVTGSGLAGPLNAGPHGFSEILYAFSSGTGNNGSAFAGLSANTAFYNTALAIAMHVGRFFFIIPAIAVAGSLAAKKTHPTSSGTFPTTNALWVGLLCGTIVIVGGLTFFPALALGPVVEHLMMAARQVF